MTDAYDLFILGIVLVILNKLFPSDDSETASSFLAVSILVGTAIGQIIFGLTGDIIGRKKMFVITLAIVIIFALASAFAFPINGKVWISLAIFRMILGIGIGGEYPLSASIAAESAPSEDKRGIAMASVFSMQGLGNFFAPIVILVLMYMKFDLDIVWRVALGLGALPGILTFNQRLKLHETHKPTPHSSVSLALIKENIPRLIGTAGTWFLFDITFYGNGLFKETVIDILQLHGGDTDFMQVRNTAVASLVIAAIALPGYWIAIPCVERFGRKFMQIFGFIGVGLIFFIMGQFFEEISKHSFLFVLLYGLTFFFSNVGPNTTTYIIPGEAFPASIRSTCHGISSAAGKLGAIVVSSS
eukprot:TRINITY_DN5255_c0_g1_i2.p1 TRINITY_DN5255_c0_g1~~TRINITY_DN5255_c0_g1_i2.p1  ORF type:complete len:403 (+),score=38.50 TRINITY_DN5255_c0_g1_i2:137-1210(+)